MHASQLVELSTIVASQHDVICKQSEDPERWNAPRFWTLSKSRLNLWAERIQDCQRVNRDYGPRELSPRRAQAFWALAAPVLEEIFLAEVCTRVWCATLSALDELHYPGEFDPIARSIFIGQLEARRRALRVLLFARGLEGIPATRLNHLRRDCEIWTDMLIARLSPSHIALQYAFEKSRARNYGQPGISRWSCRVWSNQLVGLRLALAPRKKNPAVCGDLNAQLAASLMACLPSESFDPCGVPRLGWFRSPFLSDQLAPNLMGDLFAIAALNRANLTGLQDRL